MNESNKIRLSVISRIMPVFQATIGDAKHFKSIISAIRELMDDVSFECRQDGVYMQGMDSSHISLIELNLNKEYFEEYKAEEDPVLHINLKLLAMIMKCADSSDSITMNYNESKAKLEMSFSNDRRTNTYEVPLTDLETSAMEVPEIEHDYIMHISPKEMNKYISSMTSMGVSDITYTLNGGEANIKAEAEQINFNLQLLSGDEDESDRQLIHMEKEGDEELTMTFSYVYIQKFMKGSTISDKIEMKFAEDMPLTVEFNFENGKLLYFLAPKMDDDD